MRRQRALPLVILATTIACALPIDGRASAQSSKRIVLVAGRPSHGPGQHEHNAGVALLQRCLAGVPGIEPVAHFGGWPTVANPFAGAAAVLVYADGGNGHPAIQENRLQLLDSLVRAGVGLATLHYATEVPRDRAGQQWMDWLGAYYETNYSVNPIWRAEFASFPNHPITRGVQPFSTEDEWYFNLRFRPGMTGITPILQARPSDDVRDGPYVSPRGPYPHIVAANGATETMAWAMERPDGGRGFGYTGGHFHQNWGNEQARKLVLNALLWVAKMEVPTGGVSCNVTPEDLQRNLDPKPPRN